MSQRAAGPVWPLRRRRAHRVHHRPLAEVLARPAVAGVYPGFRAPEDESRARSFLIGSLLLHGTLFALLLLLAQLAPEIEPRIIELTLLRDEPPPVVEPPPPPPPVAKPEPPPIARPAPAPPPKPVRPRPEPVVPKPEPVAPRKPSPQIDHLDALAPPPPTPSPARRRPDLAPEKLDPAPAVAIDGLDARPGPQLDRVRRGPPPPVAVASRTTRPEAPDLAPAPALDAPPAPTAAPALRSAPARPEPVRRRAPVLPVAEPAPPRPALAPAAPAPPPPRAHVERAAPTRPKHTPVVQTASAAPRTRIPGVSLGSLAPCRTDARELDLKQRVVAAAGDRASCESPAGRFHFIETKNVNAFLMGIERAPSRRSGDRCEELTYALDCLANSPRRSRP